MSIQLFDIEYVSSLNDVDPENDNIDVHLRASATDGYTVF